MFSLKEAPNGNLYYKNTAKNINEDYRISLWLTQVAFNSKFNSKSFLLVLGSFIKSVIMTTGRAHPDLFILGMDTCFNRKLAFSLSQFSSNPGTIQRMSQGRTDKIAGGLRKHLALTQNALILTHIHTFS